MTAAACCLQVLDLVISDYQLVIDDLVSTAHDFSQVCSNDIARLSVSDVIDKFTAVKQSVRQRRESLDLMPCVSSEDVSYAIYLYFSSKHTPCVICIPVL